MPRADPSRHPRTMSHTQGWSQWALQNEGTMPVAGSASKNHEPCSGLIPAGIEEQWAILRADPSKHYRTKAPCLGLIPSGIKEPWAMPGADPCRHRRTGEPKNCFSNKNTTCYSKSAKWLSLEWIEAIQTPPLASIPLIALISLVNSILLHTQNIYK